MEVKTNELNTFFLAFMGQPITITTNLMTTMPMNEEDLAAETYPIFYEGILLDSDEEYYYLGKTPTEITSCVKKDSVVHIMVIEQKNLFEEILDHTEIPDKIEDAN